MSPGVDSSNSVRVWVFWILGFIHFSQSGYISSPLFLLGRSFSESQLNSWAVSWGSLCRIEAGLRSLPEDSQLCGTASAFLCVRLSQSLHSPGFSLSLHICKCLKRKNSAKFGSWLWASLICLSRSPVSSNRCSFLFCFTSQLFYRSQKKSVKKFVYIPLFSLDFWVSLMEVIVRSVLFYRKQPLLCQSTFISLYVP